MKNPSKYNPGDLVRVNLSSYDGIQLGELDTCLVVSSEVIDVEESYYVQIELITIAAPSGQLFKLDEFYVQGI